MKRNVRAWCVLTSQRIDPSTESRAGRIARSREVSRGLARSRAASSASDFN